MFIREVCKLGPAFIMTIALLQGASSSASAQLYTADPYDPAGRGFRQYAYPGAEEGYPGSYAARARIARQTQFDRADDDLGFSTTGRGGRRGRYDDNERLNDQDPRPTDKADRQYYAARDRRERAMVDATREPDPKKRDRMVREAEQEGRRAASDLSLSVRRSATNRATIPPAPSRATSANAANRAAGTSGSAIPPVPGRRASSAASSAAPSGIAVPRRSNATAAAAGTRSAIPPPPSASRDRERDPIDPLPSDVLERAREREQTRAISTRRRP